MFAGNARGLPTRGKVLHLGKFRPYLNIKTTQEKLMATLNKLECLSLEVISSLVKYLQVRPGAYPREERFSTWVNSSLTQTLRLRRKS
jgi:hypothetical protein